MKQIGLHIEPHSRRIGDAARSSDPIWEAWNWRRAEGVGGGGKASQKEAAS